MQRAGRQWPAWLKLAPLLAPLLLVVGLAYVLPLLGVAGWSVTLPTPGFGQYAKLVHDPLVRSVFVRTARICAIVTLATVVAAYAVAYLWVRAGPRQRLAVEFCILVPFWVSVLTRAFGWVALLSSHGLLNTWLIAAGIIDEPLAMVRNELGVVLGMVHFLVPFAVFPIASAMRALDERVLLAARGLGASRLRVFWTVFVPMTRAGIVGAALVVFVFSLGFFITPAILGGGRAVMVAELVYLRIFQSPDWGMGAALSVTLVVIVAALIAVVARFTRLDRLVG